MARILLPGQAKELESESPVFFLAGTVAGLGQWQADVARHLIKYDDTAQIACPCRWGRLHPLSRYFLNPYEARGKTKAWNIHYMFAAARSKSMRGCALFWFDLPSLLATISMENVVPFLPDVHPIAKLASYPGARVVVGGHARMAGNHIIRFIEHHTGEQYEYHYNKVAFARAAITLAQS